MGYVPPRRYLPGPDGERYDVTTFGDFGQQWIGDPPKDYPPETPYRRYIWDLYGDPGRNWMPLLNGLAIALFIGLIATIVASVTVPV